MTMSSDPVAFADLQGLAKLRGEVRAEGNDRSPETLRKVAGQFEALFVQMMLKNVRESSLNEGLLESDQGKLYQGMFDQQIAGEITKGKGLGLADVLIRQLGGDSAATAVDSPTSTQTGPFLNSGVMQRRGAMTPYASHPSTLDTSMAEAATALGLAPEKNWKPDSQDDFVAELWPHAQRAAQRLGVDPRVLVAQAALESGWGQNVMQQGNGQSSNNLFGIKADVRWDGEQVRAKTMEFRDGVLQREQAVFRAYASPAESMADYADFISSNPRYQDAIGTADPHRYALELQRAGYATDPAYARKIVSILNSNTFQDAVSQAQYRGQPAATEAQEISAVNQSPNILIDAVANRAGGI